MNRLYLGVPRADDGNNVKTGRGPIWESQNTGKVKNTETVPLGAGRGFQFCRPLPRRGSCICPTVPSLNMAIIPWRRLGHTVLVIKAGSHF